MVKKHKIKTAYLVGPIEHADNPDSGWRYDMERLLEPLKIECINPITISYLVGQNIKNNLSYTRGLKNKRAWIELRKFMEKIWGQNKRSVRKSDILICWIRTQKELLELNSSGGTIREFIYGKNKGKGLFLLSKVNLDNANSHLLDIVLSSGSIFQKPEQLVAYLKYYNQTGYWPI